MSGPRVRSLFAGIGGFDLGLERAGFTVAGQVEIDPFCQRVLAARWPGVERAGDVRLCHQDPQHEEQRIGEVVRGVHAEPPSGLASIGRLDLLVGGFPCQDLSVAGKRAGLEGARSGLFWEIVRIAKATRPTWGLFENVPGLLSSNRGSDMALVIAGLRECWPVVGWRILDSRYFGVAQRRRRVFFVCGPTEAGVAQVLALTEGSAGDPEAGGEAGAHVAHAVSAGAGGSKFGSGRDTTGGSQGDGVNKDISPPLRVGAGEKRGGIGATAIAFTERTRKDGRNLEAQEDLAYSLNNPGKGGRTQEGRVFTPHRNFSKDGSEVLEGWSEDEVTNALHTKSGQGNKAPAVVSSSVRRLTPLECERLQGFPDGWTCLCQPLEVYAEDPDATALRCGCPDSPRYRALGNAVTVTVITWLGRRLYGHVQAG